MNKVLLGCCWELYWERLTGQRRWFTRRCALCSRALSSGPRQGAHSWRCRGHFCSKGEFRPFGNPFGVAVGFVLAFLVAYMRTATTSIILPAVSLE